MTPLLQQFLAEARELLQGIADALMALEHTADPGVLNDLFRLVHTLKGNSGLFDFPEMTQVLHASEDVMDAVRNGRLVYSRGLSDQLLEAMDFVSFLCDGLEKDQGLPPASGGDALLLAKGLRKNLPEPPAPESSGTAPALRKEVPRDRPWEDLAEAVWGSILGTAPGTGPLHWVTYRPDEQAFFQGTDPFFTARQTPGVLWGRIVPRESWPALTQMNAYRCVLDFQLVTTAPQDEVENHFRYVLDQVTLVEVPEAVRTPAVPVEPGAGKGLREALWHTQRKILTLQDHPRWEWGRIRAAAEVLARLCDREGLVTGRAELSEALTQALAEKNPQPLVTWLDKTKGPLEAPGATGEELKFGRRAEDLPGGPKSLKVDQGKIDRLMDLIGELVVSKNALPYLAQRADVQYGVRDLSRQIKAQYATLNRITEAMQDAILQVRMMPVSSVFQRFPRLVRELSRRLGKDVLLTLEGEDTEADKNIVESLADPLLHIVRNSLDHGIESPDERQARGKPFQGKLTLRASQEGDRVVIEVADDGRGIDPAVIKEKAFQKGVIDGATRDRIDDEAAVNLVFVAGFSTAEAISDLSGRGVGMDVVRTAVERVRGSIDLTSQVGHGTTIRISLPLSMAVTQVMVIQADGQRFGVPLDQVLETVRVPRTAVTMIKSHGATVLRGRVVPLRALGDVLGLEAPPRPNDEGEWAVLVVRVGADEVGLLVDAFHETIDVIQKPLEGFLAGLPGYSGSALLGDGSVLMVLNAKEILGWP